MPYSTLCSYEVSLDFIAGILQGSIIEKSLVETAGHLKGAEYDFSSVTDDGVSVFNHDWESGSN